MADDVEPQLGRLMRSRAIVLKGTLAPHEWRHFLKKCTKAMGMAPAGKAATWKYPTADGKGGVGFTIVQPITESFLALDAWPDFDGAYLMVASCRKFAISKITETALLFGLDVDDVGPPVTSRLG